jgi:hypothetical protein
VETWVFAQLSALRLNSLFWGGMCKLLSRSFALHYNLSRNYASEALAEPVVSGPEPDMASIVSSLAHCTKVEGVVHRYREYYRNGNKELNNSLLPLLLYSRHLCTTPSTLLQCPREETMEAISGSGSDTAGFAKASEA